jgi:hypothetical protein
VKARNATYYNTDDVVAVVVRALNEAVALADPDPDKYLSIMPMSLRIAYSGSKTTKATANYTLTTGEQAAVPRYDLRVGLVRRTQVFGSEIEYLAAAGPVANVPRDAVAAVAQAVLQAAPGRLKRVLWKGVAKAYPPTDPNELRRSWIFPASSVAAMAATWDLDIRLYADRKGDTNEAKLVHAEERRAKLKEKLTIVQANRTELQTRLANFMETERKLKDQLSVVETNINALSNSEEEA